MKGLTGLMLGVLFVMVGASGPAWAAGPGKPDPVGTNQQVTAQVTQGELAKLLVEVLGLARFLPANPTAQQCFSILMANGISPATGWLADKAVTRADLARTVVQSMKKVNEIKNPDDPQAWIDYLVGIGVPIDTIGLATKPLEPLALSISPQVYTAQVDPLLTVKKIDPASETQFGTIMTPIRDLFAVGPIPPRPVTPE